MTTPPWCREKVMVYYIFQMMHNTAAVGHKRPLSIGSRLTNNGYWYKYKADGLTINNC